MQWRKNNVCWICFFPQMYTELELGRFHTNGASQGRGWWHRTVQHSGTHMEVPEGAYCKREREYTPHMSMSNVSTAKPLSPSLQFFFYRRNSDFPLAPLSYCTQVPPMQPHIYTRLFTCQKHSKKQWARIVRHVFHVVPDTFHGAI